MDDQSLIVTILMMLAVGGVFYVFVYPYLSGQEAAEKRRAQVEGAGGTKNKRSDRQVDPTKRRQQILESVRELENETRKKKNTLASKLLQAGLATDVKKFYLISGGVGVGVAFFTFVMNGNPIVALGAGVAAVYLVASAWSVAMKGRPWARALGAAVCFAAALAVSFLAMDALDVMMLEGISL